MDDLRPANPYSPPASELNQGLVTGAQSIELAERGTRLVAASLDGLLITVPLLPMLALGIYVMSRLLGMVSEGRVVDPARLPALASLDGMAWWPLAIGLGFFAACGIVVYQWILISRTGQSLGKKWTGIRIERIDGTPITFGTGVVLRNWVPKLIGALPNVVWHLGPTVVPYLGSIFHLVDCLYIYREDRRCLHDHIAGTRVVRYQR